MGTKQIHKLDSWTGDMLENSNTSLPLEQLTRGKIMIRRT